jgi:hypothetical protein
LRSAGAGAVIKEKWSSVGEKKQQEQESGLRRAALPIKDLEPELEEAVKRSGLGGDGDGGHLRMC